MSLIEIPLLNFKVRFRPLTWREAFALPVARDHDPATLVLAKAMVDVVYGEADSGGILPIATLEDAQAILSNIPLALRSRVWLIYQGSLPDSQHFTTRNLYRAPNVATYNRRVEQDEDEVLRAEQNCST